MGVETGGRSRLKAGPLSDLMGFHLRLAQLVVYRDFANAVADLNLTQRQYAVLELIEANAGASQIDLASALVMDRATMMALVDRLQARGFLVRSVSAQDRRRQALHLTEAGQAFLASAREAILAHEERMFGGWTKAERAAFKAALKRLGAGVEGVVGL